MTIHCTLSMLSKLLAFIMIFFTAYCLGAKMKVAFLHVISKTAIVFRNRKLKPPLLSHTISNQRLGLSPFGSNHTTLDDKNCMDRLDVN